MRWVRVIAFLHICCLLALEIICLCGIRRAPHVLFVLSQRHSGGITHTMLAVSVWLTLFARRYGCIRFDPCVLFLITNLSLFESLYLEIYCSNWHDHDPIREQRLLNDRCTTCIGNMFSYLVLIPRTRILTNSRLCFPLKG